VATVPENLIENALIKGGIGGIHAVVTMQQNDEGDRPKHQCCDDHTSTEFKLERLWKAEWFRRLHDLLYGENG
jgi:hypothetical protein